MSASLIAALTCGVLRSLSVMNALRAAWSWWSCSRSRRRLVAPPLIHWPTAPFRLCDRAAARRGQTAPRQVVLRRLQRDLRVGDLRRWPCRWRAGSGRQRLTRRVACCVCSAAFAWSTLFCAVCSVAFCAAIVFCKLALALSSAAWRLVDAVLRRLHAGLLLDLVAVQRVLRRRARCSAPGPRSPWPTPVPAGSCAWSAASAAWAVFSAFVAAVDRRLRRQQRLLILGLVRLLLWPAPSSARSRRS